MENRNRPELPDYVRRMLDSGTMTDDIFLDAEGRWFHNGEPFLNQKIIDFFNESIDMTPDGIYVIHYGDYVYPVRVADTALFVTGVTFHGFGSFEKVVMNLSDGRTEELDPETLTVGSNNALYCTVRNGSFKARFRRSPSFHVLERLDEIEGKYYLGICGKRIEIQRQEDL